MEAELEKIRREFKELEEVRNQLVNTIEILNRDAEVNEVGPFPVLVHALGNFLAVFRLR